MHALCLNRPSISRPLHEHTNAGIYHTTNDGRTSFFVRELDLAGSESCTKLGGCPSPPAGSITVECSNDTQTSLSRQVEVSSVEILP